MDIFIYKMHLKYMLCYFSLFNPDSWHIWNYIISGNSNAHSIFILLNRINLGFIKCFLKKCFFIIQNNLGFKRIFKSLWGAKYFLRFFFWMIKFYCSIYCQWITIIIKVDLLIIRVIIWSFIQILFKFIWYSIWRSICYQR